MSNLARSLDGSPIHALRPNTTQSVAYTGTAGTITNAVGAKTTVVRVVVSTDAYIAVGASPTATANDMPMTADMPEYFRVIPGVDKISAIQASSGGTLTVTEMI